MDEGERKTKAVVIHPKDNVAIALTDLQANFSVNVRVNDEIKEIRIRQNIPRGHKFALTRIEKNQHVIKYGETIGIAVSTIKEGEHVHVHNVVSQRGRGDLVREKGKRI